MILPSVALERDVFFVNGSLRIAVIINIIPGDGKGALSASFNAIDKDYLEAFANLKIIAQSQNFDANSASNQFRQALGMNMQGSETRRVSMYGNRYNFDKALRLFGAKPGYGAQK